MRRAFKCSSVRLQVKAGWRFGSLVSRLDIDRHREILIVCIYVDDGLVISNSQSKLDKCIKFLNQQFEIKANEPKTFVGLEISRGVETLKVSQRFYLNKVVSRFELQDAKPVATPMEANLKIGKDGVAGTASKPVNVPYRQAIGSLMYAAVVSRPDISFSVGLLARYCEKPLLCHWMAVKRVLRYIKGTTTAGITYQRRDKLTIEAYSDADFGGDVDDRKSTSGYLILLNGAPISWKSQKQTFVSTSTCESEYTAASLAAKELMWLQNLLGELGLDIKPSQLYVDNQSTIKLITNDQSHNKTKHLDIKLHFMRDICKREVNVCYVETSKQIADILTKPLANKQFSYLVNMMGISGETISECNIVEVLNPSKMIVVNKDRLMLISLILLIGRCDASFLLGEKHEIRPYEHVVAYGSPCSIIHDTSLLDEINKINGVKKIEQDTGKLAICRSPEANVYEQCLYRARRLELIISEFPVLARKLSKRNIVEDIYKYAKILGKIVISGATMYIKGSSKGAVEQTASVTSSELLRFMQEVGMASYRNLSLVPVEDLSGEAKRVSRFVKDRSHILEKVISDLKEISFVNRNNFYDHSRDELTAAEVLLTSIGDLLKEGHLDTEALGELIEDSDIMAIDPRSTRIRLVENDKSKKLMKFNFDVIRERSIAERVMWIDVLVCIGFVIVMSAMPIGVYILKVTLDNKKVADRTERVVNNKMESLSIFSSVQRDVEHIGKSGDVGSVLRMSSQCGGKTPKPESDDDSFSD